LAWLSISVRFFELSFLLLLRLFFVSLISLFCFTAHILGPFLSFLFWSCFFVSCSKGCLPVTDALYSNFTGYVYFLLLSLLFLTFPYSRSPSRYMHTSFYDITIGISDPTVFIPPQGC
jgi:hypothetical protein